MDTPAYEEDRRIGERHYYADAEIEVIYAF